MEACARYCCHKGFLYFFTLVSLTEILCLSRQYASGVNLTIDREYRVRVFAN